MNTIYRYNILLIPMMACILLWGCKKTRQEKVMMSAKVNGTSFAANYCGSYVDSTFTNVAGYRQWTPTVIYPKILLKIAQCKLTPQTYTIGGNSLTTAFYYRSEYDMTQAVGGSITVADTIMDSLYYTNFHFNGNFEFICADGTTVTGGSFKAYPWFGFL